MLSTLPSSTPCATTKLTKLNSPAAVSLSPRLWLCATIRASMLSTLEPALGSGHLVVADAYGVHSYGSFKDKSQSIHIRVTNDTFWLRLLLNGDVGFAEAYMLGDLEIDNLKGVMNLWLDNESAIVNTLTSPFLRVSSALSGIYNNWLGQSKTQSRLNVVASYDQSNELFQSFLSREMMYSCALWGPSPETESLEGAQIRKLHHVLDQARLLPGQRVLEVGSGWGALAIEAARRGVEVDTLTLSKEQKALAEERIAAAGLSHMVRVHLMDYRDIPQTWGGLFDAFISIEMLEHVGAKYYPMYFRLASFALKLQGATVVVTSTTFPESKYSDYQPEDFMRKYMYPNSCLPSPSALITAATSYFTLQAVENHSQHYPRTLYEWADRLERNLTPEALTPSKGYRPMPTEVGFDFATFKRKWRYFFAYAGAGFEKGYITNHMFVFSRPEDVGSR